MKQYIVIKQFILKDKTFRKDKLLTAADVGEGNVKRLEQRKYIKATEAMSVAYEETPDYLDAETFLTPVEVNRLKKAELIEYAKHIGVPDFDPTLPNPDIRKLVNDFIAEVEADDNDEDDTGGEQQSLNNGGEQ